jgi:hypothetical protein
MKTSCQVSKTNFYYFSVASSRLVHCKNFHLSLPTVLCSGAAARIQFHNLKILVLSGQILNWSRSFIDCSVWAMYTVRQFDLG